MATLYLNQGSENTGWLNDQMIDDQQAAADNVQATPTILVGKSGGTAGRCVPTSLLSGQIR